MTRYQVTCAWCGKSPDFTIPTDPVCGGCKLAADSCTCSSRTADGDCRICESFGSHADCLGQRNDPLIPQGIVKAVGKGSPETFVWWCGFYETWSLSRWHGAPASDDPRCGQISKPWTPIALTTKSRPTGRQPSGPTGQDGSGSADNRDQTG